MVDKTLSVIWNKKPEDARFMLLADSKCVLGLHSTSFILELKIVKHRSLQGSLVHEMV